ncbi:MAG: hypothetical protein Q9170_002063 [Blastenia crenularia]
MESNHLSEGAQNRDAPWFKVPNVPVVGIEHPCLISNIGKAIDTLGGQELTSALIGETSVSIEAGLRLHPGNPNSKPIPSFNTKTKDVLLKITVPQRTGRKRKRGSNGVFSESTQVVSSKRSLLSDPDDAKLLFQSMREHSDKYQIKVVGKIQQTHRFRRLPDFVWSTENSPFMAKMREHILPFEYPRLKNFELDMSKGVQERNDIPPPPLWTRHSIPFNYSYCRKSGLKRTRASTDPLTFHDTRKSRRNKLIMITIDTPSVPTAPSIELPPESSFAPALRELLVAMREVLSRRPLCTRRVVQNEVPADVWKAVGSNAAKQLWQYIGFLWISGPWRDTICTFGLDPRKHKELRRFQTVGFQVEPDPTDTRLDRTKITKSRTDRNLADIAEVRDGHLFDGITVRLDGKLWQLCDISDLLLKSLIDTEVLRDECHILSDGWYTNGLWAKIKVIMKAKITAVLAGHGDKEQLDNELLQLHQKIPDVLTDDNRSQALFDKNAVSARMMKWAEAVRTTASRPGGRSKAWGPETAKQKAHALRVIAAKKKAKKAASGRGRGRPSKDKDGMRREEVDHGEGVIDPRLRDLTIDSAEVERQVAFSLRESDIEVSDEQGSEDEATSNEGSDSETSDSGDSDEGSDADDSDAVEDSEIG